MGELKRYIDLGWIRKMDKVLRHEDAWIYDWNKGEWIDNWIIDVWIDNWINGYITTTVRSIVWWKG